MNSDIADMMPPKKKSPKKKINFIRNGKFESPVSRYKKLNAKPNKSRSPPPIKESITTRNILITDD